jgi:hypothetical protein
VTELITVGLHDDEVQLLINLYRQKVAELEVKVVDLETKVGVLEAVAVDALKRGAAA